MEMELYIGLNTLHGRIVALMSLVGERYVWTLDQWGTVGMFPESVIRGEGTTS